MRTAMLYAALIAVASPALGQVPQAPPAPANCRPDLATFIARELGGGRKVEAGIAALGAPFTVRWDSGTAELVTLAESAAGVCIAERQYRGRSLAQP